jgi:membrane protease YdiL (CAAX protease family)
MKEKRGDRTDDQANGAADFAEDELVFVIEGGGDKSVRAPAAAWSGPHLPRQEQEAEERWKREETERRRRARGPGRRLLLRDGLFAGGLFVVFMGLYTLLLADDISHLSGKVIVLAYALAGVTAVGNVLYLRFSARAPGMLRDLGLFGMVSARRFAEAVGMFAGAALVVEAGYWGLLLRVPRLSRWLAAESGTASIERMFRGMGVWVLLLALVLAPVCEEVIFRGMLFLPLRRRYSRWPAVLVSALLFTLVHPLAGAVPVFAMGCCAALSVERSGSLWAGMLVHGAYNLLPAAVAAFW